MHAIMLINKLHPAKIGYLWSIIESSIPLTIKYVYKNLRNLGLKVLCIYSSKSSSCSGSSLPCLFIPSLAVSNYFCLSLFSTFLSPIIKLY